MASPNSVDTFIQGEKLPVDVGAIEKELATLWQNAAESDRDQNGAESNSTAVMRACTLNLVVHTDNDRSAEDAVAAIAEFTSRHPCRTIVLVAEREAEPDDLNAYVSAHCHLPVAGAKQVCCEQITVHAQGKAVEEVSGVVLPLLINDLQVVLWWTAGLPESDELFERLLGASDRLILDSGQAHDLGITLAAANALAVNWKPGHISDLAWHRLEDWRECIAEVFEPTALSPLMAGIEKLSVAIGGNDLESVNLSQPVLLSSWLAVQLGWKLLEPFVLEDNRYRSRWNSDGHEIVGEIKLGEGDAGEISAVNLEARSGQQSSRFLIRRTEGQGSLTLEATATASVDSEEVIHRNLLQVQKISVARMMADELDHSQRDEVYVKTLLMATQMV